MLGWRSMILMVGKVEQLNMLSGFELFDIAMLFLDFSHEQIEIFKSKYREVAGQYSGKGLIFLMGNVPDSQNALQYFGLKEEQTPTIVVQNADGLKYINQDVQFYQIAPWLKDLTDGKLKPFIKSEAIPETNDEPVKVVS